MKKYANKIFWLIAIITIVCLLVIEIATLKTMKEDNFFFNFHYNTTTY